MKDWGDYDKLAEDAVKSGSAVVECAYMADYELAWGKWYRSKGKKGGFYPFGSNMLNKKWTLGEEFNKHMLKFQQVKVSSIYFSKLHFYISGWIDNH